VSGNIIRKHCQRCIRAQCNTSCEGVEWALMKVQATDNKDTAIPCFAFRCFTIKAKAPVAHARCHGPMVSLHSPLRIEFTRLRGGRGISTSGLRTASLTPRWLSRSKHSLRLDRECDSSRIAHPRDYIVNRGVTVRPHSPLSAGPYMQNLRPPPSHRPTAAATHDQPVGHGREWKEGS